MGIVNQLADDLDRIARDAPERSVTFRDCRLLEAAASMLRRFQKEHDERGRPEPTKHPVIEMPKYTCGRCFSDMYASWSHNTILNNREITLYCNTCGVNVVHGVPEVVYAKVIP